MVELERSLQVQAQELSTLNAASTADVAMDYIQNCATATVHQASPSTLGRARCGWCYDGSTHRARRKVAVGTYRVLPNLDGIPGDMICERCLPADKAAAHEEDLIHVDVSGDEQPVDLHAD